MAELEIKFLKKSTSEISLPTLTPGASAVAQ